MTTPTRLNMTQAAKLAGISRNTLHTKIKKGIISKSKDSKGKPYIELSELLRIYPDASLDHDTQDSNGSVQTGRTITQAEYEELVKLRVMADMFAQKEKMLEDQADFYKRQYEETKLLLEDKSKKKKGILGTLFGG